MSYVWPDVAFLENQGEQALRALLSCNSRAKLRRNAALQAHSVSGFFHSSSPCRPVDDNSVVPHTLQVVLRATLGGTNPSTPSPHQSTFVVGVVYTALAFFAIRTQHRSPVHQRLPLSVPNINSAQFGIAAAAIAA